MDGLINKLEDKINGIVEEKYGEMIEHEKIFKQAFQEQQYINNIKLYIYIDIICIYRINHKLKVEEKFERFNKRFRELEDFM